MHKNIKRLLWIAGVGCILAIGTILMAEPLTINTYLDVNNGNFKLTRNVQQYKVQQLGVAMDYGIISLSVTATNTLPISNVTTPRYCYFRNLSTNDGIYVTLTMYLRSNDVALLPLASTNVAAYAAEGTPELEYWFNQE